MDRNIFQDAVTDYSTTQKNPLGQHRWVGDKCYKYILNGAGEALVAGRLYYHSSAQVACTTVYKMGASGTVLALLAGVGVSAIPDGSYGWIQVFGSYASIGGWASGLTAVDVGGALMGSSGETYAILSTALNTAPKYRRHIIALETLASSVTVVTALDGFIHCL
jgi:hypothetical protein